MRVEWNESAREQVDELASDRSRYSEDAGDRLKRALLARALQIARFPHSGRMIPEFGMAHLRKVIEAEFRVMYEVFDDHIEVFGVMNARRDPFGRHHFEN